MKRAILVTGGFLMLRYNEPLGTFMILAGIFITVYKEVNKTKK